MSTRIRSMGLRSTIAVVFATSIAGCGAGDSAGVQKTQLKSSLAACNRDSNPRYTLAVLDSLGGNYSWAYAINNRGQVVGTSRTPDNVGYHAVVWNGTTPTDLGAAGVGNSVAYDINEAGQIVGQQGTASGWTAASWFHDGAAYLENQPGGVSAAYGIDASGRIVGESEPDVNAAAYASVWNDGQLSTMNTLGGIKGIALKINNAGDIVGVSANASGEERPTLWVNAHPVDLGTLGGSGGQASAINNQGQIVGTSDAPYGTGLTTHATLWYRGAISDLGTLGGSYSRANAINNAGQIVGVSTGPDERAHPVIWPGPTASPIGIDTLVDGLAAGLQIEEATGINDRGQIVAAALQQDGSTRAVVLTPAGCQ